MTDDQQQYVEYLWRKLGELEEWLADPRAKNNGSAYISSQRATVDIRREIAQIEEQTTASRVDDPTAGMTDDELVAAVADSLQALPLSLLDRVLDRIGAERTPRQEPSLHVVTGGRQ